MFRFIAFIARFREYVVFAMLIVISIALMSLGNAGKLAGFRTFIIGGVGLLQNSIAWMSNPLTIASENAALRELNYTLGREIVASRRAAAENQQLQHLLRLRDTVPTPLVSAKIVGMMRDKSRYYLTLNVGERDSIQAGMAVVSYNGLVGSVLFTSDNYCTVQTVLDRNARIAVRVERNRLSGIVSWENSEKFWLKNVSKRDTVYVGDVLLTSEYSSRFPADISLGRIVAIEEEPNTLFRKIEIEPLVHFPTLEYVFVRREQPDAERLLIEEMLEKRMQKKP